MQEDQEYQKTSEEQASEFSPETTTYNSQIDSQGNTEKLQDSDPKKEEDFFETIEKEIQKGKKKQIVTPRPPQRGLPPTPIKNKEENHTFLQNDPEEVRAKLKQPRSGGGYPPQSTFHYQTLEGGPKERLTDPRSIPLPKQDAPTSKFLSDPVNNYNTFGSHDENSLLGEITNSKLPPESITPLGELLAEHLSKPSPKIKPINVAFSSLALVNAFSVFLMYYVPTEQYTKDFNRFLQGWYQFCVNAANGGVGYYTTIEMLNAFRKTLPSNIAKRINPQANKNKIFGHIKNISLLAASIIAALPYALAAGPDDNPAFKIVSQIIVGLAFGAMNFYGLNNLAYADFMEIQRKLRRSQRWHDADQLLEAFAFTVMDIVNSEIRKGELSSEFTFPIALNGDQLLEALANKAIELKVRPHERPSFIWKCLTEYIPGTIGGSAVLVGLMGLALKTEDIFDGLLKNKNASFPLSAAALSIFAYLAFRFGYKSFVQFPALAIELMGRSFQYLRGQKMSESNLSTNRPLAMQLYPLATLIGMGIVSIVCLFSYATAVNFIEASPHFNKGGELEEYKFLFKCFAGISSVIFNNFANQELLFKFIETFARFWGSEKKKNLANFAHEMRTFLYESKHVMDPKIFAESLQKLPDDCQFNLTNMKGVSQNLERMLENIINEILDENQSNSTLLKSKKSVVINTHEDEPLINKSVDEDVPVLDSHAGSFWRGMPTLSGMFKKFSIFPSRKVVMGEEDQHSSTFSPQ